MKNTKKKGFSECEKHLCSTLTSFFSQKICHYPRTSAQSGKLVCVPLQMLSSLKKPYMRIDLSYVVQILHIKFVGKIISSE